MTVGVLDDSIGAGELLAPPIPPPSVVEEDAGAGEESATFVSRHRSVPAVVSVELSE
jgi:hypothetical protein